MKVKRSNVIMLPTKAIYKGVILLRHLWKNQSKLECKSLWQYNETINIGGLKQYTTLNGSFRDIISSFQPQHLYITTDEEIKEGDWVMFNNQFEQAGRVESQLQYHAFKKIIATTDKALNKLVEGINGISNEEYLPQPSKAFIEKYCKAGGIDEVMVEYTTDELRCYKCGKSETNCINTSKNCIGYFEDNNKPKVNSHNEITIHPIKNSWNREEVENLLHEAYAAGYSNHLGTQPLLQEEWIKKNL